MNLPQLAYTPSKQNRRAYWSLFQQNPYSADVTMELRICHDYSGDEPDIKKIIWRDGDEIEIVSVEEFEEMLQAVRDYEGEDAVQSWIDEKFGVTLAADSACSAWGWPRSDSKHWRDMLARWEAIKLLVAPSVCH